MRPLENGPRPSGPLQAQTCEIRGLDRLRLVNIGFWRLAWAAVVTMLMGGGSGSCIWEVGAAGTSDVRPKAMGILKVQCSSCHNATKQKGGLVLESREAAMRGGDNGAVIVPHAASKSLLAEVLTADADPHMPPKKQLSQEEIRTLRDWIDQGADWDDRAYEDTVVIPIIDPAKLGQLPVSYHPVLALALSGNEKCLAVGRGNKISVYELGATNSVLVKALEGHRDAVQSLAWSGDGKWLASGGFRRIVIWNMETFVRSNEITNLTGRITALAFTPDSTMLIGADGNETSSGVIRAWEMDNLEELKTSLAAHDDSILDLAVSSDGTLLASASVDKLVRLWKLPSFEVAAKLEGHNGHVLSVAFNTDGTRLASGSADSELKIWDPKTGDQVETVSGHPGPITGLEWMTGKKLLTICEDGNLRLCDETKKRPEKTVGSASDIFYTVAVCKDPDRRFAGCHDGLVYVWNSEGKLLEKLGPPIAD